MSKNSQNPYFENDSEESGSRPVQARELRRLMKYILRHRWLMVLGLVLILLATAATLLEPRLLGYAIDDAIVPGRLELLRRIGIFFLLTECVRVLAMIGQGYLFALLGQRVMQDLRLALFSHLQRLPVSTYDKNPAGRLVTRVTNDISALAEMFSAGFVSIIANILVVGGILVCLFALNAKLALVSAAIFPLLAWSSVYFSKKLRVSYREARSKLSALNAFLAENLVGMRVVQLFNREKLHQERFAKVNQSYTDAQIGTIKVFALFQPTITWAQGIAMALVVWYGGTMAAEQAIQLGVLFAFFSYVLSLFQPIREIADKWNLFLSGMASAERIFSILDWPVELSEEALETTPVRLEGLRGHIVFEDVSFAYEGLPGHERWVLKNFNLEIRPGMRVGVVGHTGAGKTTLISLLMRFYEPQRGRILLDGRDLREYDRRALRAAIGIVQQDVFLFSGTVADNVSLWREGLDGSAAAVDLPGEGKELFERGVNLSMGERQMIAFSRAMRSDPKIWILDEATANIDSHSEQELERRLETYSKGRTCILIAHRLATVRQADLILVLHKGELAEQGNHASLMAQDGIYSRLYRLQATEGAVSPSLQVTSTGTPVTTG